jgi:hypothetical protein
MAQHENRRYYVVHRGSDKTRVLAQISHGSPHRSLLDPYLSQLAHSGADGSLLLVDAETRELVLRCPIKASISRRERLKERAQRFWLL